MTARQSFVRLFAILWLATLFAAAPASAQTVTAAWSGLGQANQTAIPTPVTLTSSDGNSVVVTRTLATNGGMSVPSGFPDYMLYSSATMSGLTAPAVLAFNNAAYDPSDKFTVEYSFNTAVTNLRFSVGDIDRAAVSGLNYRDAVEVWYDNGSGVFVNAALTSSFYTMPASGATVARLSDATVNGWYGIAEAANDSATTAGNVAFNFGTTSVKRVRIIYFSYTSANQNGFTDPDPYQYIDLSNLTYDARKADLSLTKSVVTAAPYAGGPVTWRLTLSNASSSTGTPAVTVKDTLPSGFSYGSSSGSGSFSSSTGIWSVASIAPGASVSLDISGTISAASGTSMANVAEVASSTLPDPDSTPNNGITTEDDYARVVFTVAPGSTFICDSRIYLSQGNLTQLKVTSANTNPLTFTNVGSASAYFNAIGYNPGDNFMYGFDSTTATSNRLYRISADGTPTLLGAVTNLPAVSSIFYNAGAFIAPNKMLIRAGNVASDFYLIDVTTMTATQLTQPAGFTSNVTDLAYNPVNGKVYGVGDATLFEFTVGLTSVSKRDLGPVGVSGFFGALFSDSLGNLYGANNNGGFYSFSLTNGAASLISDSPGSSDNDGSNCYNAAITFATDPQVTKTDGVLFYSPGGVQTYTIVVSNPSGPFGAGNVTVSDPLPSGIPAANVTYTAVVAGGATTLLTGQGTGALNDTVSIPKGGSVTYTVNVAVPADRTIDLVNTATIVTGGNIVDANTANNTATDTDKAKAKITVVKTSALVSDPVNGTVNPKAIPDAVVDYTITVSNIAAGAVDTDTTFVVDMLPAGITFFNGDANGAAPGTDAVNFTNAGSGLTFTFANDVRYSNAATAPTAISGCTYTPAAGYDPQVKFICLNPKGTFAGNATASSGFSVQFRSKIK